MTIYRRVTHPRIGRRLLSMMTGGISVFVVSLIASLLVSPAARAAPQILAVAATDVAQPLHCADGVCAAEFSAFCLQKHRSNPVPGTAYTPYADDSFTLVFRDKSGEQRRVSANNLIQLSSNRGFTSVVAQIDESTLEQLGAALDVNGAAGLEVAGGATLIPAPIPGDDKPITEAEVAQAIGTLRPMADQWLGGAKEKAQAVRIVNTLINLTPLVDRLSKTDRGKLWDQMTEYTGAGDDTFQAKTPDTIHAGAVSQAKEMHDACLWRVEVGRYVSMRQCLGVKHDSLLQDMNLSYWKASGAGS